MDGKPDAKSAPSSSASKGAPSSSSSSSSSGGRPVHPASLTSFGPGRGSGSSELCCWAYLTRPRPPRSATRGRYGGGDDDGSGVDDGDRPLPNLVTACSNSLRVYTVLPNAGTLALTAVYDNLAGCVCTLDVVPDGTGSGGVGGDDVLECGLDGGLEGDGRAGTGSDGPRYDGLLLGFAGRPRLSVVYPSVPMVGRPSWSPSPPSDGGPDSSGKDTGAGTEDGAMARGVGSGGVLLASSIVDLTPILAERSSGGTGYLEHDLAVSVSTSCGCDVDSGRPGAGREDGGGDPCVTVVLGGGVAVASFSLARGERPDGGLDGDGDGGEGEGKGWWRVASEPYALPLSSLSPRIRPAGGGQSSSSASSSQHGNSQHGRAGGGSRHHPPAHGGALGPAVSHGFGDVLDAVHLAGYTEPTLLLLHSNPARGGRAASSRLGRTASHPDGRGGEAATGTSAGLTLTAVSVSIRQRRSVVLWSVPDGMPADAFKLVAHPHDGALVVGVNTVTYVGTGGRVRACLAVNGFARAGCPPGLLPPDVDRDGSGDGGRGRARLEANPSPLPRLAMQLDGARVSFVTGSVALVCLGNGAVHALEIHPQGVGGSEGGRGGDGGTFLSVHPLGHRVGGLGAASCLSVLSRGCHGDAVGRYLKSRGQRGLAAKKEEPDAPSSGSAADADADAGGPRVQSRGLIFVGSRMGDCTLLAYSMNERTRLEVVDVDDPGGVKRERKEKKRPDESRSGPEGPRRKAARLDDGGDPVEATDGDGGGDNATGGERSRDEILRLEEEELYREDDDGGPAAVSDSADSDAASEGELPTETGGGTSGGTRRRRVRMLTRFRSVELLDCLTGLGPLGAGTHGPVATAVPPSADGAPNPRDSAADTSDANAVGNASAFGPDVSSAARHYVMPCGFGSSGGLAVLTTPGRDAPGGGGTVRCEADVSGTTGRAFGLPNSGLLMLGREGGGCLVLRGADGVGGLDEVDLSTPEESEAMDVEGGTSFRSAEDVLRNSTVLAASEFGTASDPVSIFLVEGKEGEYSAVVMTRRDDEEGGGASGCGLKVDRVHRVDAPSEIRSVTPMVSRHTAGGDEEAVFGCVWSSGSASVLTVAREGAGFDVREATIPGGGSEVEGGEFSYGSDRIAAMDVASLPDHIFESGRADEAPREVRRAASGGDDAPMPMAPDRLSMHGTWVAPLDGSEPPPSPDRTKERIVAVLARRSGALEVHDAAALGVGGDGESTGMDSLLWKSGGCSHGVPTLGPSSNGAEARVPKQHDVEAAELRVFVAGPSLPSDPSPASAEDDGTARDSWMLRSLCVLVDTTQGDLHLYTGTRRGSGLVFDRVPLGCVGRPSEEQGRHLGKLRRKRMVPPSSASSSSGVPFRPNRLHRFAGLSSQDGLFAATPRPIWLVAERGAVAAVSHKSRHAAPAGGRPVPVPGFCPDLPPSLLGGRGRGDVSSAGGGRGFVTVHERIGRVGSQRLTAYSGIDDLFAPRGLLPGGGLAVQKVPLGVTVRSVQFVDDASVSSPSSPVYAVLVSHECESRQDSLNDDGLTDEERQAARDAREAERVRKQVEADLGGFEMDQEWVAEIERDDCFAVDPELGLAPPMPTRRYEVWLVDGGAGWRVMSRHSLDEDEHGTALEVMYLSDLDPFKESDETPDKNLAICVGTSVVDHDGEDLSSRGRVLVFGVDRKKTARGRAGAAVPAPAQADLVLLAEKSMTLGPVTSLSSLVSGDVHRVVVGAGAEVTVEQWHGGKLTQVGFHHAHMMVQNITIFKTFFLLSDAYDSLFFLVWRESDKSLTLLAKDYEPTQVFASGLISRGGAMSFVCHDERQNLKFLQYSPNDPAARGGNKLVCRADFHIGSQTTSLTSHWCQSSLLFNSCTMTSTLAALKQQDTLFGRLEDDNRFAVNYGTSDGSFASVVPLSEPTYWRLTALQSVMSNALESNAALSHRAWRLFRRSTRRSACKDNDRKKGVIDGDVVMKFADLPLAEQEDLASSIGSTVTLIMDNLLELSCAASVI